MKKEISRSVPSKKLSKKNTDFGSLNDQEKLNLMLRTNNYDQEPYLDKPIFIDDKPTKSVVFNVPKSVGQTSKSSLTSESRTKVSRKPPTKLLRLSTRTQSRKANKTPQEMINFLNSDLLTRMALKKSFDGFKHAPRERCRTKLGLVQI